MKNEEGDAALRVLRKFFRISAFIFLLLPFSFTFDESGATRIMWRDSTLPAVTVVAFRVG